MSKFQFLGVMFIYLVISSNSAIITGSDKVSLVSDMYLFNWSVDDVANTITFTMDVGTTGWVGMGFSTNFRMLNSDMYIGYVDSTGKVNLGDFYNRNSQSAPDLDTAQGGQSNVSNISGTEASGRTKITFTRPLQTGDSLDFQISQGTTYNMIFAYHTLDPSPAYPFHIAYYKRSLVLWAGNSTPITTTASFINLGFFLVFAMLVFLL